MLSLGHRELGRVVVTVHVVPEGQYADTQREWGNEVLSQLVQYRFRVQGNDFSLPNVSTAPG